MIDLTKKTLCSLVEGIKKKEFTSEEITISFINNSQKAKKLNTYITENFDKSLVHAKNFDKKKNFEGLLSGIPIAVKDLLLSFHLMKF